ncbi:hypothetical protein CL634_03125 [bacterium]|nr:hypothetical protein [bacterium]
MKVEEITNFLEEHYLYDHPNLLLADNFEEAFVGVVEGFNLQPKTCYDYDKCIEILERDMDREEAIEFFHFNVEGAYVGEHTPCFIKSYRE